MKRLVTSSRRDVDWTRHLQKLDSDGHTRIRSLLTAEECNQLSSLYTRDSLFRSRVVMARHNFGRGEYKYFNYPLPDLIVDLRNEFYPRLVDLANRWNTALRNETQYPSTHQEFLERCHKAGQQRPTPLLLKYQEGDYNCLHQDLYGEHVFPIQMTILLSRPDEEFTGGEFVLTEQKPRMQSRATVVNLARGDALLFAVNHWPAQGVRGSYRVNMRHGVSLVHSGERYTLGIIFHDAK